MNLEKSLDIIKGKLLLIDKMLKQDQEEGRGSAYKMQTEDFEAIETLLTAYEKEKEKNKKAIDFINERKKTVNKDMAEGTRLQVGTFMWQVDELLEILKGIKEE